MEGDADVATAAGFVVVQDIRGNNLILCENKTLEGEDTSTSDWCPCRLVDMEEQDMCSIMYHIDAYRRGVYEE